MDWPDRFSIWNPEGKVVLHGRVQAWDIWGGDYPYNDAFSYEFYFEENNTIALQNYYMDIFIKKQIATLLVYLSYIPIFLLSFLQSFQQVVLSLISPASLELYHLVFHFLA